jgi:hypothetical protein
LDNRLKRREAADRQQEGGVLVPDYSYALVELYVELPHNPYEDAGDAIQDAILSDPDARSDGVRQVLDRLNRIACRYVLFPGWTLVGTTIPRWATDRTGGRTVVIEMLPPLASGKRSKASPIERRWRTFVLRDRRVLIGPAFQLFYSGSQVGEPGNPSQAAVDLTAQLLGRQTPTRRWATPGDAALIVCGEVNIIHNPDDQARVGPLVPEFPSFDLIMNPAHKPN